MAAHWSVASSSQHDGIPNQQLRRSHTSKKSGGKPGKRRDISSVAASALSAAAARSEAYKAQQLRRSHTSKNSKRTREQSSNPSVPATTMPPIMEPLTDSASTLTMDAAQFKQKTGRSIAGSIPSKPPASLLPILSKFKRQRGYVDSDNDDEPTPTRSNVTGLNYSPQSNRTQYRQGTRAAKMYNNLSPGTNGADTISDDDSSSGSSSGADYNNSYPLTGLSSDGESGYNRYNDASKATLDRTNHTFATSKQAETATNYQRSETTLRTYRTENTTLGRDPLDKTTHTIAPSQQAETATNYMKSMDTFNTFKTGYTTLGRDPLDRTAHTIATSKQAETATNFMKSENTIGTSGTGLTSQNKASLDKTRHTLQSLSTATRATLKQPGLANGIIPTAMTATKSSRKDNAMRNSSTTPYSAETFQAMGNLSRSRDYSSSEPSQLPRKHKYTPTHPEREERRQHPRQEQRPSMKQISELSLMPPQQQQQQSVYNTEPIPPIKSNIYSTLNDGKHEVPQHHRPISKPPHTQPYLYLIIFIMSLICISSLSLASPAELRSSAERTALAFIGISTILSLVTFLALRGSGRNMMTKSITVEVDNVGTFEFKSLACMMTILFLVLWTICGIIVLFAAENEISVSGQIEIWNANLFFGTWIGFGISCYAFADGCVLTSDGSASNGCNPCTLPSSSNPKLRSRNDIARGWILLLIFSIVLVSVSGSLLGGSICASGGLSSYIPEETVLCQRLPFGVVFGVLGVLLAILYWVIRVLRAHHATKSVTTNKHRLLWNTRVDQISSALSATSLVVFSVNAGLLTSPTSGSEPCNIYLSSWICFGLGLYLVLKHVEMWSAQPWLQVEAELVRPPPALVPVVTQPLPIPLPTKTAAEQIPIVHKVQRRYSAQTTFTDEESSSSSSNSSSGSSYSFTYDEETGLGTSYRSEDSTSSSSTSSYSDSKRRYIAGTATVSGSTGRSGPSTVSADESSDPTPTFTQYQPYQQYASEFERKLSIVPETVGLSSMRSLESSDSSSVKAAQRPDPDMRQYQGRGRSQVKQSPDISPGNSVARKDPSPKAGPSSSNTINRMPQLQPKEQSKQRTARQKESSTEKPSRGQLEPPAKSSQRQQSSRQKSNPTHKSSRMVEKPKDRRAQSNVKGSSRQYGPNKLGSGPPPPESLKLDPEESTTSSKISSGIKSLDTFGGGNRKNNGATNAFLKNLRRDETLQREEEEMLRQVESSFHRDKKEQQNSRARGRRESLWEARPQQQKPLPKVNEREARQQSQPLGAAMTVTTSTSSKNAPTDGSSQSSRGSKPRHIRTLHIGHSRDAGSSIISPLPEISERSTPSSGSSMSSREPLNSSIPVIPDISGRDSSSPEEEEDVQLGAGSIDGSTATNPPTASLQKNLEESVRESVSTSRSSIRHRQSTRHPVGVTAVPSLHSASTLHHRSSSGAAAQLTNASLPGMVRDQMVESATSSVSSSDVSQGPPTVASGSSFARTVSGDELTQSTMEASGVLLHEASKVPLPKDASGAIYREASRKPAPRDSAAIASSSKPLRPSQKKRAGFFQQFDSNGDGVIDKAEMKEMFRQKLGTKLSDYETDRVFNILDKDRDGTIDLAEFEDWCIKNFSKGKRSPPDDRSSSQCGNKKENDSRKKLQSHLTPTSSRREPVLKPKQQPRDAPSSVDSSDDDSSDLSPLSSLSESPPEEGKESNWKESPSSKESVSQGSAFHSSPSTNEMFMKRSSSESALSKSQSKDNASVQSSQTIPNDQRMSVDQMVAAALQQAQQLKQTHDALVSSSPETDDSEFKSSPIKSGSSPTTSDEPGTVGDDGNPINATTSSSENKCPSSGGEQSTSSADGGRTASLNSGDQIVDEMVMEALKYAQDAKENSGHSAATTGNIPSSFHSVRTEKSAMSVHSYYSRSEDPDSYDEAPWYAC